VRFVIAIRDDIVILLMELKVTFSTKVQRTPVI
jgi:hypothetical protein